MFFFPRLECSMYPWLPQWSAWFIPMLTLDIRLDATGRVSRTCSCPAIDHRHKSNLASPIIIDSQKEGQALMNWCFWTVVLEKTLETPLDFREVKPVNPKGNQPWIFIGRTDDEAEAPILGPPDVKNWLTGKYPDAGRDWRQEEKGTTEDGMVGWHFRLNEHEFEQVLGVDDGQGSLVCCSPWGHRG